MSERGNAQDEKEMVLFDLGWELIGATPHKARNDPETRPTDSLGIRRPRSLVM
jgi:hypothetical protein